jgi:hypothetical protein
MDYSGGTELALFQWNVMARPAPLTWFDSDEDGMAYYLNLSTGLIKYFKGNADLFEYGYLPIIEGDESVSMGDIEDALIARGYKFETDPNIPGKFWIDTKSQLRCQPLSNGAQI